VTRAQSLVVREEDETVKTVSRISPSHRSPGSSPVWMRRWTVELLRQSRVCRKKHLPMQARDPLCRLVSEPRAVATDQDAIESNNECFLVYSMIRSLPLAVLTRSPIPTAS